MKSFSFGRAGSFLTLRNRMSRKTERIRRLVEQYCGDQSEIRHAAAFVQCFNRQLFYEAHEVLEELWLPNREGIDGPFYKGLIQLAGAFVHLQKKRTGPATRLLLLAQANLNPYPNCYQSLDLAQTKALIEVWLTKVKEIEPSEPTAQPQEWPMLSLS